MGDDNEKRCLAAQPEFSQYKGPWAMPTLGGVGGQTIVGAFSTGTHGGDAHQPPIADAVQAIHLIGPEGRQYWLERYLPSGASLVDEGKLRRVYGEIEVIHDTDLLNAVTVAAGRMGIIYSVLLRVVRQYALKQVRTRDIWSEVRKWANNPQHKNFIDPNNPNRRFVQVVINPNSQVDDKSEHTCFITLRDLDKLDAASTPPGAPPYGRAERCGPDTAGNSPALGDAGNFYSTICESDAPISAAVTLIIQDLLDARDKFVLTACVLTALINNPFTPPP